MSLTHVGAHALIWVACLAAKAQLKENYPELKETTHESP